MRARTTATADSSTSATEANRHQPLQGRMKLVLCDDHTLFRKGIRAILERDPGFEVVGEACDGREAVETVLRLRPDVALMDIAMPNLIGYEAIRRILQTDKTIRILVLTMHEEEEIISLCLNAGACGYILKDAPPNELIEAIHTVCDKGKYLGARIVNKVVGLLVDGSAVKTNYDTLSDREREVLKLLADGLSVKDVARDLNLSVKTIEAHKYNMMRKLGIHDKTELIKYALRNKLIVDNHLV